MTRMDYERIARVIREVLEHNPFQRAILAVKMGAMLRADNPNFDDVRFIRACCPDIETGGINEMKQRVQDMRE